MLTGIDIGGTKCAVVLGDESGNVSKKLRFETTTCKETLEKILASVHELGVGQAIGVSCGGPLDEKRGRILSPPNLPGWDDVPIVDMLEEAFGVPAAICNDANACALAEWQFGAGRGCEHMVFFTFGTGLGAGIIANGRLYSGAAGMAGEAGHVRLSPFGPVGYGKSGSFEGFCSGGGLSELARTYGKEWIQQGKRPAFWGDGGDFTVKEVADAARAGDECARRVFSVCAEMLGKGLAMVADILAPERIVLGSIYERCRDLLEEGALREFRREALPLVYENCQVLPAALGDRIGDVAALAVAVEACGRPIGKR